MQGGIRKRYRWARLTQYQETRPRLTALAFGFKRKTAHGTEWEVLVRFDAAADGYPKREGRALLLIRAARLRKVSGKKVSLHSAADVPSAWHQ